MPLFFSNRDKRNFNLEQYLQGLETDPYGIPMDALPQSKPDMAFDKTVQNTVNLTNTLKAYFELIERISTEGTLEKMLGIETEMYDFDNPSQAPTVDYIRKFESAEYQPANDDFKIRYTATSGERVSVHMNFEDIPETTIENATHYANDIFMLEDEKQTTLNNIETFVKNEVKTNNIPAKEQETVSKALKQRVEGKFTAQLNELQQGTLEEAVKTIRPSGPRSPGR